MAKSKIKEKADVWMPLFIGDYLADTTRLTTEQHGAYLLLIMDYWRNGSPPDDDDVLASITKSSAAVWKRLKPTLSRFFVVVDGKWTHDRIEFEIAHAKESKEKASHKAKRGADARWKKDMPKDSDDDASSNATSIAPSNPPGSPPGSAQAMLGQCPSPSPSPSIQNPSSAVVDSTVVAPEDWWKTAPLPEGEEPEKPNNPAVVMAVALRKLHVSVTAVHPTLLEWVAKGVTLQVLTEGVQLVRMRPGKESGPINPNYLATVLASMQNPAPARSTAAIEAKPWWESKAGIEAKGRELDLEPVGPEKEIFAYYRDRVFAKAGHGPWSEKARIAPSVHEMRKVGDVVAG